MSGGILTVTLNPALDATTTTNTLLPQQKLRCTQPHLDPGGGGVNVSRAIRGLGGTSLAFVVLGGATGGHYERLLTNAGIDHEAWRVDGETRTSLTVMEEATGSHFRFVMPGPQLRHDEGEAILGCMSQLLSRGYAYLVASGSLPPGIASEFYGRLADLAHGHKTRLILDTQGEALRAALSHKPHLIRLNHLEARELAGNDVGDDPAQFAADLIRRGASDAVIVTVGDRGAIVCTGDRQWQIHPPRVVVRSAVGAGDSFVGAMTLGLTRGWSLDLAAAYGVAAAASAVTGEATELCRAEQTEAFFRFTRAQVEDLATVG